MPPFISRDDLSDYLGRNVATDDGALIVVDAASDAVRTLAEQVFDEVSDETIVLDGSGTDALVLPQLPVTDVSEVTLVDSEGVGTAYEDYILNGHGVLLRDTGCWPAGRQNVSVTYDHGYPAETFPADVRMVALAYAARLIVQGPARREGQGDATVDYGQAATDFTEGEIRILAKYRQLA